MSFAMSTAHSSLPGSGLSATFPHGIGSEVDAVGVVYESIEDGVGQRRLIEIGVCHFSTGNCEVMMVEALS
jgi:hypothetical protein